MKKPTQPLWTPLLALAVLLAACNTSPTPTGTSTNLRALAATAYYVDSVGGNDNNPGTSSSAPWRTVARVNGRTFASGDSVLFKRGSSWSGTALTVKDTGVRVSAYGSGNRPLFKNPGALNMIVVTAGNVTLDGLAFNDGVVFNNNDGLGISGPKYTDSGAVVVKSSASGVTIKNAEFYGVGLGVKTYGTYTTITNNVFRDLTIAFRGIDSGSETSYGAVGVSLNNSNATVAYNTFLNCRSTDSPYGADGGAIEIEGFAFNKNAIAIHHNRSTGSQGFLEVTETTTSDVTIAYNLSDDYQQFLGFDTTTTPNNYRVEHNTIIRTRPANALNLFAVLYYREQGPAPAASWLSIRNNVFYTPVAKVLRGTYTYKDFEFPHANNLYYDGSADPLGYPLGNGDRVGNPAFVSASDYHLTASSPAINAALNLGYSADLDGNPVPFGSAPDMGAYEFQGASSGGGNLVSDPGFETQSADTLQSPWIKEGNDPAGVDRAQNKSRSGSNNGWLAGSGSGWNAIKQQISVQANTSYRLSVWVRNSGNLANGAGYFGVKTTGGAVVQEISYGSSGTYTQLSLDFNSGSNTTLAIHCGYYGPGTASWEQVDDWSLTAISSAAVANPSFEAASSLTTPWYTESTGTDGSFGLDVGLSRAKSGANNAWIATSGSSWNAIKQQISVQPNTNYTPSVWVSNSGKFSRGYFGVKTTGGSSINEIRHGTASASPQLSVSFNFGPKNTVIHAGYWGTGVATWGQIDDWTLQP